ncbi:hypothetical protein [Sphingosinicella sp. BN140058]|uniref:hypothetical protein n=1 Tax=Sphingosinicella sp. BN140058 TaxID=1892855 RepID=UPI001012DC4C|nr:hypothetical protein [Sphingosinicella sp. BN140058]QAY76103.1 hypothetical protein ETR14_05845 [Sphingosinicella sp. BN140058]
MSEGQGKRDLGYSAFVTLLPFVPSIEKSVSRTYAAWVISMGNSEKASKLGAALRLDFHTKP